MKYASGAGFPLSMMLALVALTAWLRHAVDLPELRNDGKLRHDPDYIVDGARMTRLDQAGRLHYTVRATRMTHYPDDDSAEVADPYVVFFPAARPQATLGARSAKISGGGEEIFLIDEVEFRRAARGTEPPLVAKTAWLKLYPDAETATTDAEVRITQGKTWVRGTGLDIDNKASTLVLRSSVTGQFVPKQ